MRVLLALLLLLTSGFAQIKPGTYEDEANAWFKAHPPPEASASRDQQQAFYQQVAEASAQWVRDWPDEPRAWLARLKWLARVKSTPDNELEAIGDTVLKLEKEHPPGGVHFKPFQTEIAEVWTERHLRPEQCLQLTQEAVRSVEQAEIDNPTAARRFTVVVAQGFFQTLTLQQSIATELKKFDVAEAAVDRMKQYLETHREHPEDRPRLEHWYLANAGLLAESEGRKPDALLYFSQAYQAYPEDAYREVEARQLWKRLGGSEEGFNAWMAALAKTNHMPAAEGKPSPWTAMSKPLLAFHGTDAEGRVWTIEDLKGRTTLINAWATWCRPCLEELPAVQSLFEQFKNRADVQLLTVSVDENLDSAVRFAERQHYTFPIVSVPSADLDKMVGVGGIPRTWIVDRAGSVRFELPGYDSTMWPAEILQQLNTVR